MGKVAKIAVVLVVAVLLVGGGIGAAWAMGAFNKETKLSFDKNYFDLKDAKGYAIAKDSIVSTASAVSASVNREGAALMLVGDDDVDTSARSFYKLTDNGYVKVKMYKAVGKYLKTYDLLTDTTGSIEVKGMVETTTLEVEGDTALIEGVSTSMETIKGSIDLTTGTVDVTYNDILREIKIKAQN